MRALAAVYALLCVLALWAIPASVYGWLGVEPDPLAAIFAIVLALPWSLVLHLADDAPPWLSAALLAAGMAANVWLLWRVQRWMQRRPPRAARA